MHDRWEEARKRFLPEAKATAIRRQRQQQMPRMRRGQHGLNAAQRSHSQNTADISSGVCCEVSREDGFHIAPAPSSISDESASDILPEEQIVVKREGNTIINNYYYTGPNTSNHVQNDNNGKGGGKGKGKGCGKGNVPCDYWDGSYYGYSDNSWLCGDAYWRPGRLLYSDPCNPSPLCLSYPTCPQLRYPAETCLRSLYGDSNRCLL